MSGSWLSIPTTLTVTWSQKKETLDNSLTIVKHFSSATGSQTKECVDKKTSLTNLLLQAKNAFANTNYKLSRVHKYLHKLLPISIFQIKDKYMYTYIIGVDQHYF